MKKTLALIGDMSKAACAHRLRGALEMTGLKQVQLADLTTKGTTSINNQIRGMQFPSREVVAYFYEQHRIDFNFFFAGQFSQLPGDVQDRLFPALHSARQSEAPKSS